MKALDTRKSAATKRLLADSLKKMMRQKPFARITVNDVIEACGVNRKTFYYHFEDMRGLLGWTLEREAEELALGCGRAIPAVMEYAEENREMLLSVCRSAGRDELRRFFSLALSGTVRAMVTGAPGASQLSEELRDFRCRFYTEAASGVLTDWVDRGGEREQTARYLEQTLRSSVSQAVEMRK